MSTQAGPPVGDATASPSEAGRRRVLPFPPAVAKALWVMIAQLVLYWIGIVVAIAEIGGTTPPGSQVSFDQVAGQASVWAVLFAVLGTGAYLLIARQIVAGRNWARVVLWIFAGLGAVLGSLGQLADPELSVRTVLGWTQIALDVALVVLLALRPSSRHFRATA